MNEVHRGWDRSGGVENVWLLSTGRRFVWANFARVYNCEGSEMLDARMIVAMGSLWRYILKDSLTYRRITEDFRPFEGRQVDMVSLNATAPRSINITLIRGGLVRQTWLIVLSTMLSK